MKSISKNKKAYFEYQILDKFIAGIKLQGSEVKSIRNGKVSIVEAYCFITNDCEIFIKGMNITEHKEGGKHNNHQPLRDRKLLMKKNEIIKLNENVAQKGLTIVPLEVLISDTGLVKIEIGLARGKHLYDKRESIKLKDLKREMDRSYSNQ
jgi:SsrA-binding protein